MKALSYRVWIDIAAVLFFLPSILYSITYREKVVRRAGRKAYDETDINVTRAQRTTNVVKRCCCRG